MSKKAFFLDRDGVVIRQVHYLHKPEDVVLESTVPEALKYIHSKGALAIVITNQSGVARGMFTLDDVHAVHRRITELLAPYGEKIDGFYICPHHPDYTGPCSCRKPEPGLFLAAEKEMDVDLANSFMAGDKYSDLESGISAGLKQSVLLTTGYGQKYIQKARENNYPVADTLLEAVRQLLG